MNQLYIQYLPKNRQGRVMECLFIMLIVDYLSFAEMEVSESYDLKVQTKNRNIYTLPHQVETHRKRSSQSNEEKEMLIRKIEALSIKNRTLVEKQDSLQNTIYDLRKLLQLVGKQSLDECGFMHNKNKVLQQRAKGLEKTLSTSHSNSKHIQKCAMYWSEFLQ